MYCSSYPLIIIYHNLSYDENIIWGRGGGGGLWHNEELLKVYPFYLEISLL